MAWLRVESAFPNHYKVMAAGQSLGRGAVGRVLGLWIVGACYAVSHLTDGFVPALVLEDSRYDRKPDDVIQAMVSVGLLHQEQGGYRIHDFNDYNLNAEAVKKKRRADLERKSRGGFRADSTRNSNGFQSDSSGSDTIRHDTKRCDTKEGDVLAPVTPPMLTFPTIGAAGKEWHLTKADLDAWNPLYPGVDVFAQCQRALAWVKADPSRRKTAKGMPKFLVGWFNRTVDNGRLKTPMEPKAGSPEYYASAGDWFADCKRLHAGTCEGRAAHDLRLDLDAAKAERAV
jgi:hypothetical protein